MISQGNISCRDFRAKTGYIGYMGKRFNRLLIIFFLGILLFVIVHILLSYISSKSVPQIKYGVTFSPRYAAYMKLDWQKIYISMLDGLKVKNLRIPTYWDILQKEQGKIDFSQTDFMLNEAGKREAKVVLVLGERQPRWPECHIPVWAKTLSVSDRRQKLLEFIQATAEKYRNNPSVWAWQIENEPFLTSFGEGCDIPDINFLQKEISLVRNLSNKPVIMTDSGELGNWKLSMQLSDIFGTTLYRQVHNPILGYVTYPLPTYFYNLKSNMIRSFFAGQNRKTIIVELQSEPWLAGGIFKTPEQQTDLFKLDNMKDYVSFAQKTGFDEVYFWGVEWWYFMDQNGHPEYLQFAKTLFK